MSGGPLSPAFSHPQGQAADLEPGLRGTARLRVQEEHTAPHLRSGGVPVLATPALIALMEWASRDATDHLLPPGTASVGTEIQVKHLAATPVGMEVTAHAELVAVEGHVLTFKVEAYDAVERVGEGIHQRFIVDVERFQRRVDHKGG